MKNDNNVTFLFLLFQFEQKTGAVFDEIVENCKYHFVPCSRSQHLSGAITPDGLASVADARPGALQDGWGTGVTKYPEPSKESFSCAL